jgi:hypothetical protein
VYVQWLGSPENPVAIAYTPNYVQFKCVGSFAYIFKSSFKIHSVERKKSLFLDKQTMFFERVLPGCLDLVKDLDFSTKG